MNSMTIWAEPIKRGESLMLESGDIQEALAWFKDKTGQGARSIVLHPKNKDFANEAGEVKVTYLGGCLKGEVWLSDEETFVGATKVPFNDKKVLETRLEMPEWDKSIAQHGRRIMSTLNDKTVEVDIFSATTCFRVCGKRGPKQKKLPEDFIKKLSIEGLGAKAIANKLKNDEGIEISYKTVQRVLSGQRL